MHIHTSHTPHTSKERKILNNMRQFTPSVSLPRLETLQRCSRKMFNWKSRTKIHKKRKEKERERERREREERRGGKKKRDFRCFRLFGFGHFHFFFGFRGWGRLERERSISFRWIM